MTPPPIIKGSNTPFPDNPFPIPLTRLSTGYVTVLPTELTPPINSLKLIGLAPLIGFGLGILLKKLPKSSKKLCLVIFYI